MFLGIPIIKISDKTNISININVIEATNTSSSNIEQELYKNESEQSNQKTNDFSVNIPPLEDYIKTLGNKDITRVPPWILWPEKYIRSASSCFITWDRTGLDCDYLPPLNKWSSNLLNIYIYICTTYD